jgi:DnaJ family protein C protein 7
MDIEQESSTTPQVPVAASTSAAAPAQSSPVTNGVPSENEERSPTPPPHRSSPSQALSDGGESFKLIGNRFYKLGDFNRAIEEYNKGQFVLACRDM